MHVSRATLNRNLKHHPRQFHDKQAAELKRQLVQKQQKQQTITVAVTSPAAEPAAAAQTTAPDLGEDLDAYIKRRLSAVQSQTRAHEEDVKNREIAVPKHPDGEVTQLRLVVAGLDESKQDDRPPLFEQPAVFKERKRAAAISAAALKAENERAAAERAAASRAAAALASVAHVDKERLELQSAREETKMRLLKQIPAHRPGSARLGSGSPPPTRPYSARERRALRERERRTELTEWWREAGGDKTSALACRLPLLSDWNRSGVAVGGGHDALRMKRMDGAVQHLRLAAALAPQSPEVRWKLRDVEDLLVKDKLPDAELMLLVGVRPTPPPASLLERALVASSG